MSLSVVIACKNLGETPLECLERSRLEYGIQNDIPMTYAGRLDPMAEGILILLIGDECKNKEKYLGLDKTYEFEILVGFETDTYDLLGKVITSERGFERSSDLLAKFSDGLGQTVSNPLSDLAQILMSFIGTLTQKYPPFSSKTVGGKQLFQLSKDDTLPDILPEHEVTIHTLQCTSEMIFTKDDLQKEILRRIGLVHGDFRQEEIMNAWNRTFEESNQTEFTLFRCIIHCSSGTYIRQLVHDIGEKIGVPLVTYSIKRIKVGKYTASDIKSLT